MARGADLRPHRREAGQVLVIVGIGFAVLVAAAGVAFDIGRFYTEKRFLQNAADAAALAAAQAMVRGETTVQAEAEARAVLQLNFGRPPNGVTPAMPPTLPVYASGFAGSPPHLVDGILISGSEVHVAVRNSIGYTFGRIAGLDDEQIGGRARATWSGNLLPIAVRRFVNAPGPNPSPPSPCTDNQNQFLDFFATANTACLGDESNAALRVQPNAGAAFDSVNPGSDPANHGPVVTILGQGAQPNNGADFRGFITLDIRNFSTTTSQTYYNGVTAGTNPNTLKAMEANWFTVGGYPGPAFPPATTPPDPNDQVGIMSGNATGIAIDELTKRFGPGDEVLVAVYPGQVMAIPDFAIAPPTSINLPSTGLTPNAGSFKVSRNQAFSGTVDLSTVADANDPTNPMTLGTLVGAEPITYSPDPVTPSLGNGTTVQMQNVTTAGAIPGVYGLWIRGQAGSPYLTTKLEPTALVIGSVIRDFTITADASKKDAPNQGDSVTFTLTLQNAPNKNTNFGGPVDLSVDGPSPPGLGAITFGSTSVTPSKNGTSTTLTINSGTAAPGAYRFVVRAKGLNCDPTPRSVTHLLPLTVHVAPSGSTGDDEYLDIVGFAVMRIATVDSNTVAAYAITSVKADMNDPELRRGQTARLVPWS